MSAKSIREYDGKKLLYKHLFPNSKTLTHLAQIRFDHIHVDTEDSSRQGFFLQDMERVLDDVELVHPWLKEMQLVVKPDQLVKRRGKSNLIFLNASWCEVRVWLIEHAGKSILIDNISGRLSHFLVEPFVAHSAESEYYVCFQSVREGDEMMFYEQGGIEVGDVDTKAQKCLVLTNEVPTQEQLSILTKNLPETTNTKAAMQQFLKDLFQFYVELHFTYLEINPIVHVQDTLFCLDMAAKLDQTAEFECFAKWHISESGRKVEFPGPFGLDLTKEEMYISELDSKTGASLKLTILNSEGRIWTMVAGGGASVAYADAICNLGYANELANYGEYSGAPNESQTYEYAKTILDLMTRSTHPSLKGKVLFIGGGIANFTNVATTFKGIIRALKEYYVRLNVYKVKIYIRRGGPNYQEGLRMMRELGDTLELPIYVFSPDIHITAIVTIALTSADPSQFVMIPSSQLKDTVPSIAVSSEAILSMAESSYSPSMQSYSSPSPTTSMEASGTTPSSIAYELFNNRTRAFVYGMQLQAVQGMLDFDYMYRRKEPSVAAMIYPFGGSHNQKAYWGSMELLIPVYSSIAEAFQRHKDVQVVVNFASCRSVYDSVRDTLIADTHGQLRVIAIIAEGVPERRSKQLVCLANEHNRKFPSASPLVLIGPATVGGIKAGCFKIGNTGGMIDNLISAKLYRPGSVAYVSKSGGMSNELNNILSRTTDGVYEGVAIGGDRYPGSTFLDHCMRFQADPDCKMIVLLGEVGGVEEYRVVDALASGSITKPVIAWCIGTCASLFHTEVQFGHAGACARSTLETAISKNAALLTAGAHVPRTFEDMPELIGRIFFELVRDGQVQPRTEAPPPKVPMDSSWAQELGLIRKQANFVSTICDDRGQELIYAGKPISSIFEERIGVGGVISLLWFKRLLPDYACRFIEMVLILTADHGPAVSGAHNTIVAARAGKDLVSSLASGLLTIGDRFGGALDGAAEQFSSAFDQGLSPSEFVDKMRKQRQLILGIGHKIKSRSNPDHRVVIVKKYAKEHFPATQLLDYALAVEEVTTAKKDTLILNVDGAIGVLFVDLLRHSGSFSAEEAHEYIKIGTLNGLFVLGRSIGFIGHYLDQKRLKQGLYRHPWDDISYLMANNNNNN